MGTAFTYAIKFMNVLIPRQRTLPCISYRLMILTQRKHPTTFWLSSQPFTTREQKRYIIRPVLKTNYISAKENGTLWAGSGLSKLHTRHSIATVRSFALHRKHPDRNKYLSATQRTHEFLRSRRCNSRPRHGFPTPLCKHPVEWRLDRFEPIVAEQTGLQRGAHVQPNFHAKQPLLKVYGGRVTCHARALSGGCIETSNCEGDNDVDNTEFIIKNENTLQL